MIIYVLGLFGFVSTIGLNLLVSLKTQTPSQNYYGYFRLNVLFEALAVFVWFKDRTYKQDRLNKIVQKLSKYSLGAYLVHVLVIRELNVRFGLNTLSFHPAFSVIGIGVSVFVISFGISAILNQIPIVKKYIV